VVDWSELAAWAGWATTVGGYAAWRFWPQAPPPPPPPPDPVTEGWHQVLLNATGERESVRRVRDGSAPTRIERSHGRTHVWYRLVRVEGLSLIYEPEPTTK